ncbi:MAG: hypothetical protein NT001_01470 [Candidatus Woesearchaeota archaeon]|nr:hypothetical protein [Candidatus Woesearchaeota archaeon]
MREDEKMYKYHTNSIRALLKGDKDKENLYSLGEKLPGKGNNLFFKEGYMLKLHQRFAEKDFEWQDPDSIYAPERYMKKEIVGGDEKKVSPENADKADAQNTKPGRTADKGQDKSAGNGAMPELEQTVAAEAVKKAAAKGFFPVEDAIYFMLPARYDSRQGGCIGAVNGLRARIKEYALNYLKNSGIQCLTDSDDSAVISPGEITGFYNKVIREFQNEMQAFIKKFGFIDDEQPDIRFTPNETLALFKNIYEVYTKEKNQLSRKELCRRLGKTCSNSTLAHKHLDTIWEFVLDMKATTRNMITCKVEENEALTILRNYGIIDPEAFLIEKSDDLMAENNRLFQKPLVEAAMKRRFEMQKPYVFYTLR